MARKSTAKGSLSSSVTIDVTFNGHSGDLPSRLQKFLVDNHSTRGSSFVRDGDLHYFRATYKPRFARKVVNWLREEGVVFPRKRADE